jgi:hypothetical protein
MTRAKKEEILQAEEYLDLVSMARALASEMTVARIGHELDSIVTTDQ